LNIRLLLFPVFFTIYRLKFIRLIIAVSVNIRVINFIYRKQQEVLCVPELEFIGVLCILLRLYQSNLVLFLLP
jgi:hypothetical protein